MRYFLLIFLFATSVHAKTLVIVGDSITEGLGVSKESAYPAILEEKIKSQGWKVINSGISGSTTSSAVSRIKWILGTKPDLVMIALGANDGLRGIPVGTITKNLDDAMALLKKEKIPIVLAGLYLPPNFGKKYSKEFSDMFLSLSKKYDTTFIPFLLDKVGGDPKLNLPDGIHPNEAGQKIIADTVYEKIKGLLK